MNARQPAPACAEPLAERRLRALVEQGLPLVPRPWQALAEQCGLSEAQVMACVRRWQAEGLVKRLGLVVRHRALGITANAMVVWDVPDAAASEVGRLLARQAAVTLCYRRPRRLPVWRYNLFSMVHGQDRQAVSAEVARLRRELGLEPLACQVLFSRRRFKQCGARYSGWVQAA